MESRPRRADRNSRAAGRRLAPVDHRRTLAQPAGRLHRAARRTPAQAAPGAQRPSPLPQSAQGSHRRAAGARQQRPGPAGRGPDRDPAAGRPPGAFRASGQHRPPGRRRGARNRQPDHRHRLSGAEPAGRARRRWRDRRNQRADHRADQARVAHRAVADELRPCRRTPAPALSGEPGTGHPGRHRPALAQPQPHRGAVPQPVPSRSCGRGGPATPGAGADQPAVQRPRRIAARWRDPGDQRRG